MSSAAVGRADPRTEARHAALRSPLPAQEAQLAVDTQWLRRRAQLFATAAERPFTLMFDLAKYSQITGIQFHDHYVAQVYRGEYGARLAVPLMAVNLRRVRTREDADRVLAHETMHLKVPSAGHKVAAFAAAQRLLDLVGALA